MVEPTTRIELSGDFFTRDIRKTLSGNAHDMMQALVAWAEEQVRSDILAHAGQMPGWSGWTADSIRGEMRSQRGRPWRTWGVILASTEGMDKADAIRTKAALAGRRNPGRGVARGIEQRFRPMQRTRAAIRRARPLLNLNLTKGLE